MSNGRPTRNPVPLRRYPATMPQRGLSQLAEAASTRTHDLGLIGRPNQSLRWLINQGHAGRDPTLLHPDPLHITLTEGTWYFPAGGFDISRGGLVIDGRGVATFKRTTTADTASMLQITARNVTLRGLRIEDAATTFAAITTNTAWITIEDCEFVDCFQALNFGNGNQRYIRRNRITARTTGAAIEFTGTSNTMDVSHNTFPTFTGSDAILAPNTVTYSTFIGNSCTNVATDVIDIFGLNNVPDSAVQLNAGAQRIN